MKIAIVLLLSVIAVLLVSGCAQTGNVVNTDKETPSGTGQEQTTQPTITPTPTSTQSTELSKTISPEKDVFITVKQIVSFSEKGKYGDEDDYKITDGHEGLYYEYKEGWKMVFVDFEIENNQKTSYSPGLLFTCKIQDKEGYTYDYVVSGGTSPKIDEFSNSNTQPKEKEIVALAFKTPNDFVSHRVICGTYFDMINNNPQYVFEIPSNIIISGTTSTPTPLATVRPTATVTPTESQNLTPTAIATQQPSETLLQSCKTKCVGKDTDIRCIIDFCNGQCYGIEYTEGSKGLQSYLNGETSIFMPSGTC